jgi:arabinose-5-phosphate isomerase
MSAEESAVGGEEGYDAPALMRMQAEAITAAAARLDERAFARAVDLVATCQGNTVLSGSGKSGIIAQKIAATLTSTGTAAVFLHPSDALHGGLGIVGSDDVAIILSNSGENDEVLACIPYLADRKVPLVVIVGNLDSTLAHHADVALDAYASREACPLNLAPTSSTSVALALGDALAMAVMQMKEITPEDFALNHPSGRLGKRLVLKVEDLMHPAAHPTVSPATSWLDLVAAISGGGLGAVTVEEGGHLLGIITDGDLRRAVQREEARALDGLRASDVMTSAPISVRAGSLAYDALQLMEDRPSQISVLPVVDELDHCVGLVRLHDLVRSGI